MNRTNLLLYWKQPKNWNLSIDANHSVILRSIGTGSVSEIVFPSDTDIKIIEGVLKHLGFKKKRKVVV